LVPKPDAAMSFPAEGSVRGRRRAARPWVIILVGLLVIPAATSQPRQVDATRHWVLERLHASLASPLQLDEIASMLFGLVDSTEAAEQPDTRRALDELAGRIQSLDPAELGCDDVVNLYVIVGFLNMSGRKLDSAALTERVKNCLEEVNAFDRASALFSLCFFDSPVPRERLTRAMESIEALQLPDGSFGSGYGMNHFYTSTHAVFALQACHGNPLAIELGQDYLSNTLPWLQQAGFIDGLLESLLMLKMMGVEIPQETRYVAYIRSRIRPDGSICCFDRPGCPPNRHAASLLLEFLRTFPARQ
jgi:hypothetical protein